MTDAPLEEVRRFWDDDASTYDLSPTHSPATAGEQQAWLDAMGLLLPPVPARVLDVGTGTGFLSLLAARLGHRVTGLDLSAAMLARLGQKAQERGLDVSLVEAPAHQPPAGPFDAVISRHLLWTLPDPAAALAAWRAACPEGRLVLFESRWGAAASPAQARKNKAQKKLQRLLGHTPEHHAEYSTSIRAGLPLARGARPEELVALVESAGWGRARVEPLADVDRATAAAKPIGWRVFGVNPAFALTTT